VKRPLGPSTGFWFWCGTIVSAAWPVVAPLGDRWTMLVDPHFQVGDTQDEIQKWSQSTRIVCVPVVQRELFSHALAWVDREVVWQVSFEGELDDRPWPPSAVAAFSRVVREGAEAIERA
jgi:hypothetical protein